MTFAKFKELHKGGYIKIAAQDIPGFAKQSRALYGNCDDMTVVDHKIIGKDLYRVSLANTVEEKAPKTLFRIMYRMPEMKTARSAVVLDETDTKLVEARFNSVEVAQEYARRWFDNDPEVIIRITKVRPDAKCAFRVIPDLGSAEEVAES